MKPNYYIGIDPGTNTGIAIWATNIKKFVEIRTVKIHLAITIVKQYNIEGCLVRFEDARQRTWFGNAGREKLQGVGSVKRDCAIWEDFLTDHKIPFEAVKPSSGTTKWNAEYFKKVTGWKERTSEHSRDAAVLVFQKTDNEYQVREKWGDTHVISEYNYAQLNDKTGTTRKIMNELVSDNGKCEMFHAFEGDFKK